MPYHITNKNKECSGWAVVKDDDNKVMGCHKTKEGARQQLSALYANETNIKTMINEVVDEVSVKVQSLVDGIRENLGEE